MLVAWTITAAILAVVIIVQGRLIHKLVINVLQLLRENEEFRRLE